LKLFDSLIWFEIAVKTLLDIFVSRNAATLATH
jgi:hypothetical protein